MTRKDRIKKMLIDSAEAETEAETRAGNEPTEHLTDEQINEDIERAAKTGSMILALAKNLTDCPTCCELAMLMALASIMNYNESQPESAVGLLTNLMEQKSLMETVFTGTRVAVIPAEALADAMTPRDPKDIQ
jgi:hypothetical protein